MKYFVGMKVYFEDIDEPNINGVVIAVNGETFQVKFQNGATCTYSPDKKHYDRVKPRYEIGDPIMVMRLWTTIHKLDLAYPKKCPYRSKIIAKNSVGSYIQRKFVFWVESPNDNRIIACLDDIEPLPPDDIKTIESEMLVAEPDMGIAVTEEEVVEENDGVYPGSYYFPQMLYEHTLEKQTEESELSKILREMEKE